MNKGKYIVIEGIDTCGKSTLIRELKKIYPNFLYVSEPDKLTHTMNQKISHLLLHENENLNRLSEVYLYAANRAQLLVVIKEALMNGQTVVSDRNFISSLCYQISEITPFKLIYEINKPVFEQLMPDQIFILQVPYATIQKRLVAKTKDCIEQRGETYFKEVYLRYKQLHVSLTHYNETLANRLCYLEAQTAEECLMQIKKYL